MKAKPVLLKPRLSSHTTLTFLIVILDQRPRICGSYLGRGTPVSAQSPRLILQERYRCFLLSLPRIVLNLKNVFFSYFINKNVMLNHPRRSCRDPPRKMRLHPQQVPPLKTHAADSLQQRELVKLYFLCLYYENSSLLLVPKLWNSVII